jgi:hypothetical protein
MQANSFNIPHFVSAETPEGLRAAMLKNNIKYKSQFNYFSIIYDGKRYIAFFYMLAKEANLVKGQYASVTEPSG